MKITRAEGNVRFGSRAWARKQKEPWTWRHVTFESGDEAIEILCGGKAIAYVDDDWTADANRDDFRKACALKKSCERGGEDIGHALMYDLCEFVRDHCDTECDDVQPLEFV
jgi:hypothetical protein